MYIYIYLCLPLHSCLQLSHDKCSSTVVVSYEIFQKNKSRVWSNRLRVA